MKGTFFQRPVEFNLVIEGESWNQGDPITGTLTVKNHGTAPLATNEMAVHLGHGLLRKVHAKDPEAFDLLKTVSASSLGEIAPQGSGTVEWKFETDRNSPITDSTTSLFVLYGKGAATEQMGALQLSMQPYPVIRKFIETFTTQFRFILKAQKASKGRVEAKLTPPDSQAFATLDYIQALMHFDGENLEVQYLFNVKKLEATAASIDAKKKKKDFKQSFSPTDYLTSTGRVNDDRFEQAIKVALDQVQSKVVF